MFEFQSTLFQGDPLLQAIADDAPNPAGGLTRISRNQNSTDPAVFKVQLALLDWRPGCLPDRGADGEYGGECEIAVHAFKLEEIGVPEAEIIDDVGPLTVQQLDAIRAATETPAANAVVTLLNQYGEPLVGVEITANDGVTATSASSDAAGQAALAIGAAAEVSLDEASLLGALGDLLDRPDAGLDPGGATVIIPNGAVPAMLEPGGQLDLVVAARIDLEAKLLAPLEGDLRVEGPGLRLGLDGETAFLSLQAAGGAVATVELDPPPSEGDVPEPPALDPWVPPAGYVVQAEDTEAGLAERLLGDPAAFARISDHPPVPGELLALPPEAVPGWVAAAGEPLPDPPLPQTWFTVSPDEILAVLYLDGDPAPYHDLVERVQAPPPAAADPVSVAAARGEAIAAFLALGPEGWFGEEGPIEDEPEGGEG